MSTVAAGTYLRLLREHQRLSRQAVAEALSTSDSQIERIELGQTNTRGTMWFQVAELLSANIVELARLLTDARADKGDGAAAAEAWLALTSEERAAYRRLLASTNGRARLLRSVARVAEDPEMRSQAQGYLDRLLGQ